MWLVGCGPRREILPQGMNLALPRQGWLCWTLCLAALSGSPTGRVVKTLSQGIIHKFCMVQDARQRPFQLLAQVKTMARFPLGHIKGKT